MENQDNEIVGDIEWNGLKKPQIYVALFALFCGLFLSVLDGTICNVALPAIADELKVSSSDSIWIVNSFQLVIVMMLLPFAALGELFSYKKIYLWGLFIFITGSLFCALSGHFQLLVLSRIVQGLGAAMMMSINTSLLKIICPKKDLGKAIGLNATIVALALVSGPTIAGGILTYWTWPWLFIINLPFGIIAFFLARKSLPENPTMILGRKFDFKEAFLNMLTFGLFIGCVEAFSHDVDLSLVLLGFVLFIIFGAIYIKNQQHKQYPMLPLDLLQIPIFSLSVITSIISFAAQMLAMVSLPFLFMDTLGYDAAETGILMTAYPLAFLMVAPISGYLISRSHPEILSSFGLSVMCIGCFLLYSMPLDCGFGGIAWRLAVLGIGSGFFQSPNNHLMLSSAPSYRAGSAGGMLASARLIGQTLGAAFVALFFHLSEESAPKEAMLFAAFITLLGLIPSISRLRNIKRRR